MRPLFHLCLLTASLIAAVVVLAAASADSWRATDRSRFHLATAATDVPVAYSTLLGEHPADVASAGAAHAPAVAPNHFRSGQASAAANSASIAVAANAAGTPLISSGPSIDGLRNGSATPPDTQIAVGPTEIIEMVKASGLRGRG